MKYLAHVDAKSGREQPLLSHLTQTAEKAQLFASAFDAQSDAFLCGLLHDIGKYSAAFQKRIRGAEIKVDHSTAGAVEARRLQRVAAAFCIAGHHCGIPDCGNRTDDPGMATLLARTKRVIGKDIEDYSSYHDEVDPFIKMDETNRTTSSAEEAYFYTHMLYSCLVDADWLDTEAFVKNGAVDRATGVSLKDLSSMLDVALRDYQYPKSPLNILRCEIQNSLINAGQQAKGLFTLTVPTGGGKTVSSMAFALRHALKNGLRRIIYVIPYTSIIEQTQKKFVEIFGAENVIAHYVNVVYDVDENGELSDIDKRRQLATENWDAPIILTTSVQFFESLFSNRSSHCRKLHNIADSVIIFDEAQMLPVNYLIPCVWAITELVKHYGCTGVLCTATQPALDRLINKYLPGGATELCPNIQDPTGVFKRVTYRYDGVLSDEELAARLAGENGVLCVVNSRRQAQIIFQLLPPEGRYHLSTTMTAVHRRTTLDEIRARLKDGKICRVVSTSLIEAGVDVNFPCVYRAVSGLDSIIQAGGRCNREGNNSAETSIVHVFDSETKAPPNLAQNIGATQSIMRRFTDFSCAGAIEAYYSLLLYELKDEYALDEKRIMDLIGKEMAFEKIAQVFHLIEDDTVAVYIPIGAGGELTGKLLNDGPDRDLLRKLGPYAVSIRKSDYRKYEEIGVVKMVSDNTAVLLDTDYYNEETGLALSPEGGKAVFG